MLERLINMLVEWRTTFANSRAGSTAFAAYVENTARIELCDALIMLFKGLDTAEKAGVGDEVPKVVESSPVELSEDDKVAGLDEPAYHCPCGGGCECGSCHSCAVYTPTVTLVKPPKRPRRRQ